MLVHQVGAARSGKTADKRRVAEPSLLAPPVENTLEGRRRDRARDPRRDCGRETGEALGTDPDIDELELLYWRIGGHLGEAGCGEHCVDGRLNSLVVEALPVLL